MSRRRRHAQWPTVGGGWAGKREKRATARGARQRGRKESRDMKFDPFGERAKRMSMSTHVIGFRPPDERWHQMKAVYDAAWAAHVAVPREVEEFFGEGEAPDPAGVEVEIESSTWKHDMCEGVEVDIRTLPPDVHIVRVVNCW